MIERNEKEIAFEIANKLEWAKLCYLGSGKLSVYCCPLCGGIQPEEYQHFNLQDEMKYSNGHCQECLYSKLLK